MKTAMQLMLEDLELRYKVLSNAEMLQACGAIEGTIEYAKSLIIKEKEQIIDAYKNSINTILLLPSGIKSQKGNAENYYNQTYNN
jgi:hypothetical protein